MWIKEVILPTQGFFCISDVISKLYPIINEFSSRIKQKNIKEYKEFMKKIQIEEFLQRIAEQKSLIKYRDSCKPFDESKTLYLKNDSFENILRYWFLYYNIAQISSPKYKLTLIYFGAINYLFQNTMISDNAFKDSYWRKEEAWENALSLFYSEDYFEHVSFKPSFFVELLALIFGIDVKKYNVFYSIEYFDETEENFILLDKYFAHKNILSDKFFPEKTTMFEKCLIHQKYKLAKYLLKLGEGKKLHAETLSQKSLKNTQQKQITEDFNDILNELMNYNKQYVIEYQWSHIWDQIFLPVNDIQGNETLTQEIEEEKYMNVYSMNYGERAIPSHIWKQGFEYNKESDKFIFKRNEVPQSIGNLKGFYCLLRMGKESEGCILVEQASRYPGLNYMKDSFLQKILPLSKLRKEYVKIQDEYYYFQYFNLQMESLKLFSDKPKYFSEQIDRELLSERILLEMLIYPESNPTSCFLLEKLPNKKLNLIDIGSSEILVQNIGNVNGESQIYVKSILFCLNEMKSQVPKTVINKFANFDAYEITKEWLLELSKYQDDLIKIAQFKHKQNLNNQENIEEKDEFQGYNEAKQLPYFGIPIQKEAIKHLVERFIKLTKIMKFYQKKSSTLTHQELFTEIDKTLANMYENVINEQNTFLDEKYNQILSNNVNQQTFHKTNFANMAIGFSEHRKFDISSVDQLVSSFSQIGPTQALEKVKKYAKIVTLEESEREFYKASSVKNVKQFSYLLRNVQFKQIASKEVEENFIKLIADLKKDKPIDYLNFSFSQTLNLKTLKLFQVERIQTLILRNTKIADSDLFFIAEQFKCLVYLDISGCDEINFIGASNPHQYLMSNPLVFPALKTLIANNLKNLWILDVGGSHIQSIQINGCVKIQYFFLNCQQIKRISVLGCKVLMTYDIIQLGELVSMYILEGINVQVDLTTSEGQFEKAIKYIRQSYQNAINEIYGSLYFDESVGMKEAIMVLSQAFNKRDLAHVFPKIIVTNVFSNLFKFDNSKANKQINEDLFRFMFKFYQKNPHIKEIDVKSICKEQKPTTFLNIFLDQITTNQQVSTQYESYVFRNFELDNEELDLIAQIIKKTKKEGISYIFQRCLNKSKDKLSDLFEAIVSNKLTITKLDFHQNELDNADIQKMKEMFINFKGRLLSLRISEAEITNQNLTQLCEGLKSLKYLRQLDLSGNYISSASFQNLDMIFQSFSSSFQTLILDGNSNLAGEEFEDIKNWHYIKCLQVKKCFIRAKQLKFLSVYLNQNEICTLTHLNLSQNKLNPEAFMIIKEILQKNNTLKELGLSETFTEETEQKCLEYLTQGLKENSTLAILDISMNKIQNEGLKLIADCLKNNISLKQIKILEDDTFNIEAIKYLANSIQENNQIRLIELSPNPNLIEFEDVYNQMQEVIERNIEKSKSFIRGSRLSLNKVKQSYNIFQSIILILILNIWKESWILIILLRNQMFQKSMSKHHKQAILDYKKEGSDFYRLGLSIDGGGMRGIIPAKIINFLCTETKYEVHQIFDCVGGTSIGGLIALGSTGTLDGVSPIADRDEIVKIFENEGSTIFNTPKFKAMFNILRDQARYDPVGIESVLQKYFQNCKLSDVLQGTNVITTAVRREQIQGKGIAKIFKSRDAIFNDKKNFFMRDVARATSAAPTFFPSAEIQNVHQTKSYSLVDGGVGQNNPSKLVFEDIKKEALNGGNENNIFLLSLGTGEARQTTQLQKNAGALNILSIIDSFGEGASAYVDAELKQYSGSKYLRIQPQLPINKKEADLDSTDPKLIEIYAKTALFEAERYLNLETKFGPFNDRPIVEWFAENTSRKKDMYI